MYYLMNKDNVLLKFWFKNEGTPAEVPCSTDDKKTDVITRWLDGRDASKHRKRIKQLLTDIGCNTKSAFCKITHALSLNDTLWVKEDSDSLKWKDVSLYRNPFNEVLAEVAITAGVYDKLNLSTTSPEWTTDGQFGKCWRRNGDKIEMVKAGLEHNALPVYSEVLASQVFMELDSRSVEYHLDLSYSHMTSVCELFTTEDIGYSPYVKLIESGESGADLKSVMAEYDKFGYGGMFRAMIVGDCITLNVDRHFGNFGWYVSNDDFSRRTMAPIFDFNLCYLPYADSLMGMDSVLTRLRPRIGTTFELAARMCLTDSLRAKIINLKDKELVIGCDEVFSHDRLRKINVIKNVMIDRILGRETSFGF